MIGTLLKQQLRQFANIQAIRFQPAAVSTFTSRGFRKFNTCVGDKDNATPENTCAAISKTELTPQLVHHLERTSLVDFESSEALARLSEAINFAQQLFEVKTDGVEPLVSVLEDESLYLRDDVPESCDRKDILSNASVTEEDYFVAPPGNVPLEPSSNDFLFSQGQTNKEEMKG